MLAPAVALYAFFLALFVVLVTAGAPTWTYFATAAATGVFAPSIGSLVRARWGFVLGSNPRLTTAYAYESVLDEIIFVVGPLLVTLLATKVAPHAGLIAAAVLVVAGSAGLLAHRASEPPPRAGHEDGHPSALRSPGLAVLMLLMAFIGGVFGAVEISTVASADHAGRAGLAGPLLACYAGGSATSGTGLRGGPLAGQRPAAAAARRHDDDRRRWRCCPSSARSPCWPAPCSSPGSASPPR